MHENGSRRLRFSQLARWAAHVAGHPGAFLLAVLIVLLWVLTGPLFGFSDTWQLVINTATTIVTFLMVFLLQNSQNRDTTAMHVKLDELIRAMKAAHNTILSLEELEDEELEDLRREYHRLGAAARDKHSGAPKSEPPNQAGAHVKDG
jgi:low affinity Fe/Cu permease